MSSFPLDHTLHTSEADTPTTESVNSPGSMPAAHGSESQRAAQTIVVAATFTAEPLTDVLDFWLDTLGIAANVEFAPYQQVFQQLLDPDSAIARNRNGINILLVRWEDWQQRDDQHAASDTSDRIAAIAEHAQQFVATLKTVAERSPARFLVCICPATPTDDQRSTALYAELNAYAQTELESAGNVSLLPGAQIQALYPVADYYDAHSDALGHIPFTTEFFTALGTSIARTIAALLHPPAKVVVLDCDHTLWSGVCGEDGPLGIVLDEPHLALQRFIVALHDAGMLICLCSKNSEEDVLAVFDQRSDMLLKREQIVASRINWRAKSENLQALAAELQLGLDSFIFLDDNPLECAEVQASCPEVLTLQLPADTSRIAAFLDHVWAFDRTRVTAEDTRRTAMYQQNLARERARATALTLEDFLADLQLDIQIAPLTAPALPRVAQLTQRTNQFNLTTMRRSEGEIQAFCQAGGTCWTVEVADRFGDYGMVGVLLFTTDADAITVDTWLLSCRVLGKRVEYHMLARLGELAQEHGLCQINLRYVTTAKNQPAREFLESIGGEFKTPTDDGTMFSLPSEVAAITLSRRITTPRPATDVLITQQDVLRPTSQPIAAARSRTSLMQQIGTELQSVAQIHAAIAARRMRSRADLGGAFVAPETETEQQLSAIWTEVLSLDRVGRHDSFFALGGQSLLGTRLLSRVRSGFQVDLSQVALFEAPTLAALAQRIDKARDEQTSSGTAPSIPSLPRQTPTTSFPVSFAQQRLWFLEQLQANDQAYNDWIALQLTGPLNVPLLEAGLNTIIQRHETLRTTFPIENGALVQRVGSAQPLALTRIDLQSSAAAERETVLIQQAQQQLAEPFDLAHGPLFRATLFRLGDQEHLLLMWMQHIISDGWSWGVLCRELSACYAAAITGTPATLPELPIQYADYSVWQREYLQGSVRDKQLDYWRRQLADLPLLELPTDHPRPPIISPVGDSLFFAFPADLTAALGAFTQREGVTLFMTGLAALQVLLARYSRQTDLAVGTPIANRTRHETEDLIGCFVNTLVLRSRLSLRGSFRELLQHVRTVALEAYAHQDLPFEEVVDALQPERDLSRTPLFQVMFVLQNTLLAPLTLPEVAIERFQLPSTTSKFDLTLTLEETPAGISGNVEFSSALFDRPTIERLVAHFQTLLAAIVDDPDQPIGLLPLLSEAERHYLLVTCQPEAGSTPVEQCLHQLFETQAARTPHNVAVSLGHDHLTYGELDARSNQLARYLWRLGVQPETRVGLYLHRSPDLLVGMLAILKAGAAYVPIDPTYPIDRVAFMVADMQAPVIVTEAQLAAQLYGANDDHPATTICMDRDRERIGQESTQPVSVQVTPDQLAYVIYTSGSTGRPKGTLISHAQVVRLFSMTQPWFHFAAGDVWTLFHSAAFDFSVWEIWGALLHGGRLVIVPYLTSRDPEAFYDLLRSEQVTVLNQTPSAFRQLTAVDRQRDHTASDLALRLVIFGGEALEPAQLRPWFERHGDRRPQLVNMYGITETTVHVTYRPLTLVDLTERPRSVIGGPIPDLRLYVCDAFGQLSPTGAPGELYVGGAGVARGYLNSPALTAERFVPDAFARSPEQAGGRLYRSGDLARYLPNGDIEYLGRIDQQVKLRGFRIELGEIEAALKQHPAVREAVVLVRDERLVGYVVGENQEPRRPEGTRNQGDDADGSKSSTGHPVPGSALREFLARRLPEYMIPAVFVPLKQLPLTTNGKLDRKALPLPDLTSIERQATFVAPRTPAEEIVAQIWSRLLRIEQISIHDNFFELGGNSLLATQVIVRLHEIFPINVPVRSMFDRPTVAGLVESLVALWDQPAARDALDEIATIYQQMESLSEDEVKALLAAQD